MKKIMYRIMWLIPVLFLAVFVFVRVDAVAEKMSGTIDEDIVWTLDKNGVLSVSGSGVIGTMFQKCPWEDISVLIKETVIQNGITGIGIRAFEGCSNMEKILIPDSVAYIGAYAFENCKKLKIINIPSGISSLLGTFHNCENLESVELPESVLSLESTFIGCKNLKSINIPSNVEQLDATFMSCKSLESLVLPQSIKIIGKYTFLDCSSLNEIIIPEGVLVLRERTFWGCDKLTDIYIPKKLINIESAVFDRCINLKNIYYAGSKSKKEKLTIESGNDNLLNAKWYFNQNQLPDITDSSENKGIGEAVYNGLKYSLNYNDKTAVFISPCDNISIIDLVIPATIVVGKQKYKVTSHSHFSFCTYERRESLISFPGDTYFPV